MTKNQDRAIRGYSKGMRQRIKLAQALVHDPEVLFLDEPLTGTDPVARRDLMDIIQRLGGEGKSVLVSSHVLHEVQSLTPNIVLLNHGRLVAEGHVREIRDLIDKHPHHIVLVCDEYRKLAGRVLAWDDVEGVRVLAGESGRDGRDAVARRLLQPAAGAVAGGRPGDQGGVLRRRQPGSRVQIPGEQMTVGARCRESTTPQPRALAATGAASASLSALLDAVRADVAAAPARQALAGHGAAVPVAGGLAVLVRATAPRRRRRWCSSSCWRSCSSRRRCLPLVGAALRSGHHPGRAGGADDHVPARSARFPSGRSTSSSCWPR